MLGTYFSKADWHSQDYWWDTYSGHRRGVNYNIQKFPWRWERFCQFTYRQIEEIMSGYGPVDILWLDAGWVCKENNQDIHMDRIAQMARRHQPGLIIVDRTIRGLYENYQTPERTIPESRLSLGELHPAERRMGLGAASTVEVTRSHHQHACRGRGQGRQYGAGHWSDPRGTHPT